MKLISLLCAFLSLSAAANNEYKPLGDLPAGVVIVAPLEDVIDFGGEENIDNSCEGINEREMAKLPFERKFCYKF